MSLLSYIFPKLLLRTSSPINHDIRVLEVSGKPKLLVNGSRESGTYIEMLWRKAFSYFELSSLRHPQKILVIGVAGGTVIHLLRAKFPLVDITAVDIDPVMIEIGKKYFGLVEDGKNHFYIADGHKYIMQTVRKYDVVIIDVFIGRHIPDFVMSSVFLKNLKNRLYPGGYVIFNYLREDDYSGKSEALEKALQRLFSKVRSFPIERNCFFLASL